MTARIKHPSTKAQQLQNLRALLTEIPKTEIHLHLEALATVDTIWELMAKHNITYDNVSTKADLKKKFKVTSLDAFIDLYINIIQNCFRKNEDLKYLIRDARAYLKQNNIVYAEIFFAPSTFLANGLEFDKLVKVLNDGAIETLKEDNREIAFLVDVSRGFGAKNAMKNLDLTLKYPAKSIIGIGLGGAEESGPARDYKSVFAKAIKNGLHVVAHAGEVVGPESIWDSLNLLKVERIGHGISAIQDEKLIKHLAETGVPIEICPTSNLFTQKYVKSLEEHPIREFFNRGLNITLNTDDPTLFGIDLITEYMSLTNKDFFSPKEIINLVKNNLYASFLPEKRKNQVWKEAESIIDKYSKLLQLS